MNPYERIYKLLIESRASQERATGLRQLATHTPSPRHLGRGISGHFDPGEASSRQIKVTLARLQAAARISTISPLQRAQIESHIRRLSGEETSSP